jgi:peptidoglycan/LPS O-acetylase OafA/YrhL
MAELTTSSTDGSGRYSGGTIPSLDGLRALSVSLVFLSHGGLGSVIPGDLGVTVFFVLSGYLITTLMRTEFAQNGSIDFRAFYLRRCMRLMPPLLIVTSLAVVASLLLSIGGPFEWNGLSSVLLYFSNYFRIIHGELGQPPGLGVTWSLAIEEHYYLLFPPLALVLMRSRSRSLQAAVLGLLCAVILLWRCWLQSHSASEAHLEMGTDTRVDAILFGCLLAMVKNPWLDPVPPPDRTRDIGIIVACLALLAATLLWRDPYVRMTFRYSAQCVLVAVLMYLAVARSRHLPFRWLNAGPVAYVGTISYTIYLVHYLVLLAVQKYLSAPGGAAVTALAAALTVIIAALMREMVEKPCARLQRRLRDRLLGHRPAGSWAIAAAPLAQPSAAGGGTPSDPS